MTEGCGRHAAKVPIQIQTEDAVCPDFKEPMIFCSGNFSGKGCNNSIVIFLSCLCIIIILFQLVM